MKPRALFRILLKLLGVYFFILGACSAFTVAVQVMLTFQRNGSSAVSQYTYGQFTQPILQCAIGCYLIFKGEWIVLLAVPDSRRRCQE